MRRTAQSTLNPEMAQKAWLPRIGNSTVASIQKSPLTTEVIARFSAKQSISLFPPSEFRPCRVATRHARANNGKDGWHPGKKKRRKKKNQKCTCGPQQRRDTRTEARRCEQGGHQDGKLIAQEGSCPDPSNLQLECALGASKSTPSAHLPNGLRQLPLAFHFDSLQHYWLRPRRGNFCWLPSTTYTLTPSHPFLLCIADNGARANKASR